MPPKRSSRRQSPKGAAPGEGKEVTSPVKTKAEMKELPKMEGVESTGTFVKKETAMDTKGDDINFEQLSADEALKRAVLNEKAAFDKASAIIQQVKGVDTEGDVKMGEAQDGKTDEEGNNENPNLPEISYKNPTMLLNEKRKGIDNLGLKFEQVSDTGEGPNKIWTFTVELEGEKFDGTGKSKKLAKQEAAKYALIKMFNILCVPGIGHQDTVDTQQVPNAVAKGNFKPVLVPGEAAFVTFDLETTGLIEGRVMPQITQIAATELKTGDEFNTYVTPTIPINTGATDVTGISMVDGVMKIKDKVVHSVSVVTAIEQWVTWLEKYRNVCLIAHNGRRFDFPVLVTILKNLGLFSRFPVSIFLDSLSVFRKLYPKGSHSQPDLVSSLLGSTYEAHNAMADVLALGQLINFINIPQKDLLLHSFSPLAVANQKCFLDQKAANISSLDPLIFKGVCKRPTAENIAGSGLKLAHLQLVYSRGGEDGLMDVFTAKNSEGLPRVTGSKKVLEEIVPKLVAYFENK